MSGAALGPVLEEIQYLQFRYWTGTNWVDEWLMTEPPAGVEVTLGPEAFTNETDIAELESEFFRRVIYVPGQGGAGQLSVVNAVVDAGAREEVTP
jgi:hypothetical protein